jgi:hypothetical protein
VRTLVPPLEKDVQWSGYIAVLGPLVRALARS